MSTKKVLVLLGTLILTGVLLAACSGVAGPQGEPGPAGPAGPEGPAGPFVADNSSVVADAATPVETCGICHKDTGEMHQENYDAYTDTSTLELTINRVQSVPDGAGKFNSTMTFTILKDGKPFIDADGLPSLNQKRFYTVKYDSATRMFTESQAFRDNMKAVGNGVYTVEATGMAYRPESEKGEAYGYVAEGVLDTEGMTLYNNVANAGLAFGDVTTYESAANVSGCEKCHGKPYMKHGYRAPEVAGLPDFASCKTCHYDNRNGGHQDWQVLVDNPVRYAELHDGAELTDEEKAQYAYKAKLMNDVHMAHAMEFPYPQSMANCATCHEGKLDVVLSDASMNPETCKSCHAVNGAKGEGEEPAYDTTKLALNTIIPHGFDETAVCSDCHAEGGVAPRFSDIHTGYNEVIYTADGTKYSDAVTVTITKASLLNNTLTFGFSAASELDGVDVTTISPTVMVGLYGWDTKDFIIGAHERLNDDNGDGTIDRNDSRALEYVVGEEHPRFSIAYAANGNWQIKADLSNWADLIADGTVKRVEIAVMPALKNADGATLAINAPSRTFDLGKNDFDDKFYGTIINVAGGCNTCHDALATTFHSPNRGGNTVVCRMCHIVKSGGSHLEEQSRSLDSYIHAVHSFQPFDPGDIDFADPVQATAFDLHIEHTFPNFTIKNCEACHNDGMFNVPSQDHSMPGIISGTDYVEGRNINDIPSYVVGPATRTCGSCHRAHAINEDSAGELEMLFQHWRQGGYMIEAGDDAGATLDTVIKSVMDLFK